MLPPWAGHESAMPVSGTGRARIRGLQLSTRAKWRDVALTAGMRCSGSGCRRTRLPLSVDELGRVLDVNHRSPSDIAGRTRTQENMPWPLSAGRGMFVLAEGGAPGRIRTCAPASGGRCSIP